MPRSFPIADAQNVSRLHSTGRFSALKLAILQFLEPGVLPVLALALFVGGWSYGKKLSHYLHNSDVTKASTARMWLDHRNDATLAPVLHQGVQHKFLTPQLCIFAVPRLPNLSRERMAADFTPTHTVKLISPLLSLRAPPISLLA